MAFLISFILISVAIMGSVLMKSHRQLVMPFPRKSREVLNKYFPYYISLEPREKLHFERRVHQFMGIKSFIPRNIEEVTLEMKTLISACAVQLTFGLPKIYLRHFSKILVYPDNYYSTINQTYHQGEVNPRFGIIVISWKAFVKGYLEKEGLNLGLHEMAHALHLENRIMNGEFDFLNPEVLQRWKTLARKEMEHISSGNSFFREYGAVDEHELFAVAVENFFERPVVFQDKLPEFYHTMTELLKQDPAKRVS